jgi:hypothetical protein
MKLKKSAKRAGKRGVKDLPASAKAKATGSKDATGGKGTNQGFGHWELAKLGG